MMNTLLPLLRNANPRKFDEVATRMMENRRNELAELFDSQIVTLEERGAHEDVVYWLKHELNKTAVIKRALGTDIGSGNIPFVPVIPPLYLGYYGLMSLVRHDGKTGKCNIPTTITDVVKTPDNPYYIYDVADSEKTEDVVNTAELYHEETEKLRQERLRSRDEHVRLPLTVAEMIALAIHAKSIPQQPLVWWAAVNQGKDIGGFELAEVVMLSIDVHHDARPQLARYSQSAAREKESGNFKSPEYDNRYDSFRSPSCGSRGCG